MNVRIAAQTLSSSVADALEYLMNTGDVFFKDAGPTIKFIRVVDRLFDQLNSKNPFAKRFQATSSIKQHRCMDFSNRHVDQIFVGAQR